jgi:hypothetical protein
MLASSSDADASQSSSVGVATFGLPQAAIGDACVLIFTPGVLYIAANAESQRRAFSVDGQLISRDHSEEQLSLSETCPRESLSNCMTMAIC